MMNFSGIDCPFLRALIIEKIWTAVLFSRFITQQGKCRRTLRVINWISDVIYYTPTIYADICSCQPKVTTDIERCENDICQSWHDNVMFKTSFSRNRGICGFIQEKVHVLVFLIRSNIWIMEQIRARNKEGKTKGQIRSCWTRGLP